MGYPERRQFGRRQENTHGWIIIDGRPRCPCTVRNISTGGARLEIDQPSWIPIDQPSWLPFRFRLIVESRNIDTDCEIKHQHASSVGVMFVERLSDRPLNMTFVDEHARWTGGK